MKHSPKPLRFVDSSQKDLRAMPASARHALGIELMTVQHGGKPGDFKPGSDDQPLPKTARSIEMSTPDIIISEGSGNVFLDLDFDAAEAEVMKLRVEVMIRTAQRLREQGWTQAEAARRLGITQPRISRLIQGKVEDFSLDMLLTLAARAGLHPELRLS